MSTNSDTRSQAPETSPPVIHFLRTRWALIILILAMGIPASAVPIFSGLPFTSPWSAAAIGIPILGLFFLHRSLPLVGLLALVAVLLKTAQVIIGGSIGFTACIAFDNPASNGACAKSFDAPFASEFTRIDHEILYSSGEDIRVSNWNLGALNDARFDFYRDDQPDRFRPSLYATWGGNADALANSRISYVGEGALGIGAETILLPPSYDTSSLVTIPDAVQGDFTLDFSWRAERGGQDFAAITWTNMDGSPVLSRAPPLVERLVGVAVALILGVAVVTVLGRLLVLLGRRPQSWVTLAMLAGIAVVTLVSPSYPAAVPMIAPIVVGILMYARTACSSALTWLIFMLTAPLIALGVAAGQVGSIAGAIIYRGGGTDFLYYESQGRAILNEGNLRGGEDIFVYAPAMRYLNFMLHFLFGDAHTLPVAAMILATFAGLWFAVDRLVVQPLAGEKLWGLRGLKGISIPRLVLLLSTPLITSVLLWSAEVSTGPYVGLSEFPTWIILLFAIPLALTSSSSLGIATTSILLGLDFTFRANHAFGIATIGLILLARIIWGTKPVIRGHILLAIAPGFLVALLPALHNWVYGSVLQIVPASVSAGGVNNPLSLRRLPDVLTDDTTQELFLGQVGGVFAVPELFPPPGGELSLLFTVAVRAIQAGLIIALAFGIWKRFKGPWRSSALVAVPAAFLLPHLILVVYFYYPRHIVAGYLAGGIVLMAITSSHARVRSRTPVSQMRLMS